MPTSDIVRAALDHAEARLNTDEDTVWYVSFITNEIRHGILTDLGGGNYLLHGGKNYFFSARQVVYLHPAS